MGRYIEQAYFRNVIWLNELLLTASVATIFSVYAGCEGGNIQSIVPATLGQPKAVAEIPRRSARKPP